MKSFDWLDKVNTFEYYKTNKHYKIGDQIFYVFMTIEPQLRIDQLMTSKYQDKNHETGQIYHIDLFLCQWHWNDIRNKNGTRSSY